MFRKKLNLTQKPTQKSTQKPAQKETKETIIKKHDVIFDVGYLGKLLNNSNSLKLVPEYINKFFYKYKNDVFYDNGKEFELLSKYDAKQLIPKEFIKTISSEINGKTIIKKYHVSDYFESQQFLSRNESILTIDYSKPIKFVKSEYIRGCKIDYNYLNCKKDLPRDYSILADGSDYVKEGVDMYFNHMKNVLCSGIETEYSVLKKFVACSFVGKKVKICLVIKSMAEQVGKGIIINSFADIFGKRFVKTSNPENIMLYTKILEGASLINIDEMPQDISHKKAFADKMKSLITEDVFDCRKMMNQGYSQINTFNIIITSNNDIVSLSQSNKKRYYFLSVSNKLEGDVEYFKKLGNFLKDERVLLAIGNKLMEIYKTDVEPVNWTGNNEPISKQTEIKIIDALPMIVKYVKKEYLLKGVGIEENATIFIQNYNKIFGDKTSSTIIGTYLNDLGVQSKRVINKYEDCRKYIISFEDLHKAFVEKKWLLQTEIEDLEILNSHTKTVSPLDDGIVGIDEDDEIDLKRENEALKKEIEELKKLLAKPIKEVKEEEEKPIKKQKKNKSTIKEEVKEEVKVVKSTNDKYQLKTVSKTEEHNEFIFE